MIKLLHTCNTNIKQDFNNLNGYIAKVHNESHLNRYVTENRPTLILTKSYCSISENTVNNMFI